MIVIFMRSRGIWSRDRRDVRGQRKERVSSVRRRHGQVVLAGVTICYAAAEMDVQDVMMMVM